MAVSLSVLSVLMCSVVAAVPFPEQFDLGFNRAGFGSAAWQGRRNDYKPFGYDYAHNNYGHGTGNKPFGYDYGHNNYGHGTGNRPFGYHYGHNNYGHGMRDKPFGYDYGHNNYGHGMGNKPFGYHYGHNNYGHGTGNRPFGYHNGHGMGNKPFGYDYGHNNYDHGMGNKPFGYDYGHNNYGHGTGNKPFGYHYGHNNYDHGTGNKPFGYNFGNHGNYLTGTGFGKIVAPLAVRVGIPTRVMIRPVVHRNGPGGNMILGYLKRIIGRLLAGRGIIGPIRPIWRGPIFGNRVSGRILAIPLRKAKTRGNHYLHQ